MKAVSPALIAVAVCAISVTAFAGDLTQVASHQSSIYFDVAKILDERAASTIAAVDNVPADAPKHCRTRSRITFPEQPGISDRHEILIGNIFLDNSIRDSSEPEQIQVIGLRQGANIAWHTRYMLARGQLNDAVTLYRNPDRPGSLFVFFQTSNSRTAGGLEVICWDLNKNTTEVLFSTYGEQDSTDPSFSIRRHAGITCVVIYGLKPPETRLQDESKKLANSLGVSVRLVHDGS